MRIILHVAWLLNPATLQLVKQPAQFPAQLPVAAGLTVRTT